MISSGAELASLLESACHKPSSLPSPGAALALALHCICIREGFSVDEDPNTPGRRPRHSSYAPPSDWQVAAGIPNEWNFVYSHSAKVNRFKLVVSLHERTGRVLVHGSEENNVNNIHVLGLQLENYVPDATSLKTNNWALIISNEASMEGFFVTHIVRPLLDLSEDLHPLALLQQQQLQQGLSPTSSGNGHPRSHSPRRNGHSGRNRPGSPSSSSPGVLKALFSAWPSDPQSAAWVGLGAGMAVVAAAALATAALYASKPAAKGW